mgnify:CR=1 FL=1
MGPIEIMPAAAESMIPLLPDPLPRNLTICVGFKNRLIKTMSMKTRPKGIMRLRNMAVLQRNAVTAPAGLITKTIP